MLRILTYNTWLAPAVIARDVERRAARLPLAIARTDADIVVLQEVWLKRHKRLLGRHLGHLGYPHVVFESGSGGILRGAFGNGLLVASRFPMKGRALREYSGYTYHEEYFVRKGALAVTVEVPALGDVDVVNTHLGAVRFNVTRSSFVERDCEEQLEQLDELVDFVLKFSFASRLIVAGDLNMHFAPWDAVSRRHRPAVRSRNYDRLCARLGLSDAFPRDGESSASFTVDHENPYVAASSFAKGPSECVDYVLMSANMRSRGATVVLKELDPDLGRPLSDHYGVLASLELGDAASASDAMMLRAGGIAAAASARAHLKARQCE